MKTSTRKSPREVIESVSDHELEELWLKLPRQDPESVSTLRGYGYVEGGIPERYADKRFMEIHTHPFKSRGYRYASFQDCRIFFSNRNAKASVIAQTDPGTGELIGYSVYRKKKDFVSPRRLSGFMLPIFPFIYRPLDYILRVFAPQVSMGLWDIERINRRNISGDYDSHLEEILARYNLQYRYIPVKNGDTLEWKRNLVLQLEKRKLRK